MTKAVSIKDISVEIDSEQSLLFSITNSRGNIELANSTFCKISGYSLEELKGTAHSIVRHPDMPKTLFLLMWETIKSGEPFGGYLKNLSSDGRFYWVYAFIIPVDDRYLSIRIKPMIQNLQSLERLYQRLSNIEKNSLTDAEKELNHWLLSRNFISYQSWASSCLAQEIDANISISSRSFPDKLERLSIRPTTRTDLIANHTLNQVFKGYRFMHRNIIEWLRRVDQSIEMLYDFQAILMVLHRELSKKIQGHKRKSDKLQSFNVQPEKLNNDGANLKYFFDILKKNQFHHSSVLLHLSSMNIFVSQFFDYLKTENTANIPVIIDSIESMKIIVKSLLLFPDMFIQDKTGISDQINSHFESIEKIIETFQSSQINLDNIQKLLTESKEMGSKLIQHYEHFDLQKLSDASNFYQILIGGELVLEGVSNYAG